MASIIFSLIIILPLNYLVGEKLVRAYFGSYYEEGNSSYTYIESFTDKNGTENRIIIKTSDNKERNIDGLAIVNSDKEIIYTNGTFDDTELKAFIDDTETDKKLQNNADDLWEEYYKKKQRLDVLTIIVFFILMFIFMIMAAFKMERLMTKPIELLNTAIEDIACTKSGSNYTVENINYKGAMELERICDSFNGMLSALRESKRQRELMEEARQRMLAGISHDLRTPVTVIKGYTKAILDGTIAMDRAGSYIEIIDRKASDLSELIFGFHTYSRLEHPDFNFNMQKKDICEYLREYFAEKYEELILAGYKLEVDIPEELLICEFDSAELKRVFENLINNTIRHNRSGTKISIKVKREIATNEESSFIHITIGDDGAGIPKNIRKEIFDTFVTGDESRRKGGGSGLGLAIVKKIIEGHGGRIHLLEQEEVKTGCVYLIVFKEAGTERS